MRTRSLLFCLLFLLACDNATSPPPAPVVREVVEVPAAPDPDFPDAWLRVEAEWPAGVTALEAIGDSVHLVAYDTTAAGAEIPDSLLRWTSCEPRIAAVTWDGWVFATGKGPGAYIVAHRSDIEFSGDPPPCGTSITSPSGIELVRVRQQPAVVVAHPGAMILQPGDTVQVDQWVLDANGAAMADVDMSYEVDHPEVLDIDDSGMLTALNPGLTQLVITSDHHTGGLIGHIGILVIPPDSLNHAPEWVGLPDTAIAMPMQDPRNPDRRVNRLTFNASGYGRDADYDPLSYTAEVDTMALELETYGSVFRIWSRSTLGTFTVEMTASDWFHTTPASFQIEVVSIPLWDSVPPLSVAVGDRASMDLSDYVHQPEGKDLVFTFLRFQGDELVEVMLEGSMLSVVGLMEGETVLRVRAADDRYHRGQNVPVVVSPEAYP